MWYILFAISKNVSIMTVRRKNSFKCVLVIFCTVTSSTDHQTPKTCHMQEHSLNHGVFWFVCLEYSKFFLPLPWEVTSKSDGDVKVLEVSGICSNTRLAILSFVVFLPLFCRLYLLRWWASCGDFSYLHILVSLQQNCLHFRGGLCTLKPRKFGLFSCDTAFGK